MVTSRLNELFQCLDTKNGQIAKLAGFDRTNISRLRSAGRTPEKNSPTIRKLVLGLYLYADNQNELGKLCEYIGAKPDGTAEEIMEMLRDWLYEGEPEKEEKAAGSPQRPNSARKQRPAYRFFGERLDALMKLTDLSNVRLSHAIHMDSSMISRFRTGVRTPVPGSDVMHRIPAVLFERAEAAGKLPALAKLINYPASMVDEEALRAWLFDDGQMPERNAGIAENLLGIFDSFSAETGLALPPPEDAVPEDAALSDQDVYFGKDGIRSAVLRFLHTAWREKAGLLLLYSDEDQDWLTDDREFLTRWASLMSACVKNGTRIRIIHNIDRDLSEMMDAIKSWLPLYMSGMVESWYSARKRNPRFTHTIFLCPGIACIEAFHPAGAKAPGIYHYYTDKQMLEICRSGFENMLEAANPLLKVPAASVYEGTSDLTFIRNGLSVATMPEDLARSFDDPALYDEWKTQQAALLKQIENQKLNECVRLADDESLFAGKVRIEQLGGIRELFYTPEQYAMHIRNIIRLSETYPGYRIYLLPETPFPNMKLMIADDAANIIHSKRPELSFGFSHPLMCRAFQSYAGSLMDQYRMDRNTLRKLLKGKCV